MATASADWRDRREASCQTEIEAAGGQATVFAGNTVDSWSHDALVEEFRRSRQDAYAELAGEAEQLLRRFGVRTRRSRQTPSLRVIEQLRERLSAIEHIDFFGSAGRDRVITLIHQIEDRARGTAPRSTTPKHDGEPRSYHGDVWVTRPRPGVDRMASAWLIRRFIDPTARFDFVADQHAVPTGTIPFDMFGVEFSHRGQDCTFETLCAVFGIDEPAVLRLAAIVHDLDLKDGRFGAPEAATVGTVIEGLQLAHSDDQTLLAEGIVLFDSLYRAFDKSARAAGPRGVAKPRTKGPTERGASHARRRG
jgi:hypothetical protein